MAAWTLSRIRSYYRDHAELLAAHLAGREVSWYPPTDQPPALIASAEQLLQRTEMGVGGFRIPPVLLGHDEVDRLLIDLTPGEGADVATAATVALGLREAMAAVPLLGRRADPVPVLDGRGGLQLLMASAPEASGSALAALGDLLQQYAQRTPELATLENAAIAGRVLLSAEASEPNRLSWAPYSLVPGSWPGVVVPVTWDDIAAASAGMPLEVEPQDVADRLQLRGDPLHGLRSDRRA